MTPAQGRGYGRAVVFLVVCAVLWSTSGLVIKLVDWQPLSILSLRSAIAALVLLVFLASQPEIRQFARPTPHRPADSRENLFRRL